MALVIDATGTMLLAETCYLVEDDSLTSAEWDSMDDLTDSEVADMGKDRGVSVSQTEQLLHSIADALWGEGADTEWNSDTVQAIADAIRLQRPDLVPAES